MAYFLQQWQSDLGGPHRNAGEILESHEGIQQQMQKYLIIGMHPTEATTACISK